MTSKVTVDPGAHDIRVTITDGKLGENTTTTVETLDKGSATKDYWIYTDRFLIISEK